MQAADDDGVADVGDRRADQQPLIVDRAGSRRPAGPTLGGVGQHAPPGRRRRPARCPPGGGRRSGPRRPCRWTGSPSSGPRAPIVTRPRSRSRIDWPFFSAMTRSSRSSGSVASVSASTWYCSAPRSSRPTALSRCSLPSRSATSAIERLAATRACGLDLDQDLADVAPLDGDVGDVGDAADPGPQVVIGVVVQRRRVAAAGDDERDDREDRRGLPLGDRGGARRELGADLGHAGADVVQGLDHVGAGGEVDRSSSAAPRTDFDRTRTTPSTMLDDLLDRPGDGHLDVLDRQAGRLGDDDDPREGDLGIDAAGHAQHRRRRRRRSAGSWSARSARSTAWPGRPG